MEILDLSNYTLDFLNYYFVSGLINAFAAIIAGIYILIKNPKDKKNFSFFLLTFSLFAWAIPYSIWQISTTQSVALFWTRGLMAGAVFVTVFVLYFVMEFLELRRRKYKIILYSFFIFFSVCFFLNFTPLFVSHVEPEMFFPFWPKPGITYHVYLPIWMLCLLYAYYLLLKGYRSTTGNKRKQTKLLLIGFFVGILSGSTNYFLWYGIPVAPYLNIVTSIYVAMVAYAMSRYRLFEITPSVAAQTIISTMADVLFVVDENGKIVITNYATVKMFGISKRKILNKHISNFLPNGEDILNSLLSYKNKKKDIITKELYLKNIQDENISVSVSAGLIPEINGIVMICHDIRNFKDQITISKRQKKDLESSKKMLEKLNKDLEIRVLKRTRELKKLKINLEKKVKERSLILEKKNKELLRLNRLMVGREEKMKNLKNELKKLKK